MEKSNLSRRRIRSDAESPTPVASVAEGQSELVGATGASRKHFSLDPRGMHRVHHHFFRQLKEIPIETDPFPHIYVRGVFPDDFYARLIAQLPGDDQYAPFPHPYESRLSVDLKPEAAAKLGRFWQTFESWINGQDFLSEMVQKFAEFLPPMHAHRASIVDANSSNDKVSVRSHTILNRDYAHFALGPHTGGVSKFIVAIMYFASDDRFSDFGTSIYRPREAGFATWESSVYPHHKFHLVRTFPNIPNSLFIFVKTDNSFHGVEPGQYPNDGRNLLMWIPKIGSPSRTGTQLTLPLQVMTG